MQIGRVLAGLVVVMLLAGAVVGGIFVLHEKTGGGLSIQVRFQQAGGLVEGDDVVYGDRVVGRVVRLEQSGGGVLAQLRISTDHGPLVRTGSRFWIDKRLGSSMVMFDSPARAGDPALTGHEFTGLDSRPAPDPETLPPPPTRQLKARPAWLCEVRVNVTVKVGAELTEDRPRKAAGVIVEVLPGGELLVLAPAWVAQRSGELIAVRWRVELIGGETLAAEPVHEDERFLVLRLPQGNWRGSAGELWPEALADQQGLLATDFPGSAVTMVHSMVKETGELQFRGELSQGLVTMVDGTRPAGFALPPVGTRFGAQWLPLNGAGYAIMAARKHPD